LRFSGLANIVVVIGVVRKEVVEYESDADYKNEEDTDKSSGECSW